MRGAPAGVLVMASFLLFYGGLAACSTWVAPFAVRVWPPAEPIELTIASLDSRISLGLPIPSELKSEKLPLLLIVHVDCLGCTAQPPESVKQAFEERSAVNLVLASDVAEYEAIAARAGKARLIRGSAKLAEKLHAGFGPRVYIFDKSGRLMFVQNRQADDMQNVIDEARKLL